MTILGTHAAQTAALGNHVITRWEYDDLTARDAVTYTDADIGGVARIGVATPHRLYVLQGISPLKWGEISGFHPGHVERLKLAVASASTVTVGIGTCRDVDDLKNIVVDTLLTLDITDSGALGLDTGTEASDTWYSVWVLGDDNGGFSGVLSESTTTPTLPAGYLVKFRVGWVRNDASSDFLDGRQNGRGDERLWFYDETLATTEVLSAGSASTHTDVDLGGLVPPTCRRCTLHVTPSATVGVYIRPNGFANLEGLFVPAGQVGHFEVICPGQKIEYKNADTGGSTDISVVSYLDEL